MTLVRIVLMTIMVGAAMTVTYQMMLYVWRNMKMTNEEKLRKLFKIYRKMGVSLELALFYLGGACPILTRCDIIP